MPETIERNIRLIRRRERIFIRFFGKAVRTQRGNIGEGGTSDQGKFQGGYGIFGKGIGEGTDHAGL